MLFDVNETKGIYILYRREADFLRDRYMFWYANILLYLTQW